MSDTVLFPGGSVSIKADHVETRLREFLELGRGCRLSCRAGEWYCRLDVGANLSTSARSRIGMLDAIANALMAADYLEND